MNTATIASPTLSAAANSGLGTVKADTAAVPAAPAFHVRYASLFCPGRALAFPCDATGWVDLQALPGHARDNYLIARVQNLLLELSPRTWCTRALATSVS